MISGNSKKKIGVAFEELDQSLLKLSREVALAGITGFKLGSIDDIMETASLYSQISDIKKQVEQIRPTVNQFVMDVKIENIINNDKIDSKKIVIDYGDGTKSEELKDLIMTESDIPIKVSRGELPVKITLINDNGIKASCRLKTDKTVVLLKGSVISGIEDETLSKKSKNSRLKYVAKDIMSPTETGHLILNTDLEIKSLQIATDIVLGSKIKKVSDLWQVGSQSLTEYLKK